MQQHKMATSAHGVRCQHYSVTKPPCGRARVQIRKKRLCSNFTIYVSEKEIHSAVQYFGLPMNRKIVQEIEQSEQMNSCACNPPRQSTHQSYVRNSFDASQ